MLIILKCSKIFVQFCIERLNSMQAYKQRWNYVISIQQQQKNLGTMQNHRQKKTTTKSEKKKILFESLQVLRLFKNSTVTLIWNTFPLNTIKTTIRQISSRDAIQKFQFKTSLSKGLENSKL